MNLENNLYSIKDLVDNMEYEINKFYDNLNVYLNELDGIVEEMKRNNDEDPKDFAADIESILYEIRNLF